MTVTRARLQEIYAETDDPWNFVCSRYEQEKFRTTRTALTRPRYASALEIGCGNGELARHLAPFCDAYTGIDAVGKAVAAARRAVPSARFVQGYFPGQLPEGNHDLIILSEILYFLTPDHLTELAEVILRQWPSAEMVCVTYLGDTGNELQGEAALAVFAKALGGSHRLQNYRTAAGYRIDRVLPEAA